MIKSYTVEGIEGGKDFDPASFPDNDLGLENGTVLRPAKDMPWCGLKANQEFTINWDGKYVRAGGLTWLVENLSKEIEAGIWQIATDH